MSMRVEIFKRRPQFSYQLLTAAENSLDKQKAETFSDPCHNCKSFLRLHSRSLITYDMLRNFRLQFEKGMDGNLVKMEKEKGQGT